MYSFRELKKMSKKSVEGKEIKLAVLGNCARNFFRQQFRDMQNYRVLI